MSAKLRFLALCWGFVWLATFSFGHRALAQPLSLHSSITEQTDVSEPNVRDALKRGLEWLSSQQDPDGAWRSESYGQMRTGAGNTALIVYALSGLDDTARQHFDQDRLQRAIAFLLASLDDQGFVRAGLTETDYPTYSTALTLLALKQLNDSKWNSQRSRLVRYLVNAQRSHNQGAGADDPQYGAWDQTGGPDAASQRYGQVDIAITSLVVRSLRDEAGVDQQVFDLAQVFLNRCRSICASGSNEPAERGGFFFTTAYNDSRNKAGLLACANGSTIPRAYGTSTVDGILGLLACGAKVEDEEIRDSLHWLANHPAVETVPGFVDEKAQRTWGVGLRFYYWAGLSQVLNISPPKDQQLFRTTLLKQLLLSQKPDGSWQNESHAMREDDPLIATALAVVAIQRLNHTVPGESVPH